MIAESTIVKFNHPTDELEKYDANLIWDAHSLISAIEKDVKSKYIVQENFCVKHADSMRNEVNASLVVFNAD